MTAESKLKLKLALNRPEARAARRERALGENNPMYGVPSPNKGQTYEELYGSEKATKLKQQRSEALRLRHSKEKEIASNL